MMSSRDHYSDPELMRRFGHYIECLRAFVRELKRTIDYLNRSHPTKHRVETVPQRVTAPGPRRLPSYVPHLPADLGRLNMLRRALENASYSYFSYRPGIHGPPLSEHPGYGLSQHFKDQEMAQYIGLDDQASAYLPALKAALDQYCRKVHAAYRQQPDAAAAKAVLQAVELIQLSDMSTPNTRRLEALVPEAKSKLVSGSR